jgi:uncharacterized membrane protein YkvA (DUF1232 family)
MNLLATLKDRALSLRADSYALFLVARDPRTPWYAKLLAAGVVAYAVSPIDLIPDFIPVLGYLDDLIVVPLGITLAIKLVPDHVMAECRAQAAESVGSGPRVSLVAGAVVVGIWVILAAIVASWVYRTFVVR